MIHAVNLLALIQLLLICMASEHLHNGFFSAASKKLGFVIGVHDWTKVGHGITPPKFDGRPVICTCSFLFGVEGSQPDALMFLVDLSSPSSIGLRNHTPKLRRRQLAAAGLSTTIFTIVRVSRSRKAAGSSFQVTPTCYFPRASLPRFL